MTVFSLELVRVAFGALVTNRLRSGLTMLGIVIGTGAVIAVIGLGKGAEQAVLDRITQWGSGRHLFVRSASYFIGGRVVRGKALTSDDARALKTEVSSADGVLVMNGTTVNVRYRGTTFGINVIGTTPDYDIAFPGYRLLAGRFLTWDDCRYRRAVAVLCNDAMKNLGGSAEMIGDEIRVRGDMYAVVGILEAAGRKYGFDLDDDILVPIEALEYRQLFRPEGIDLRIVARSTDGIATTADEVRRALRRYHHIAPGAPDDFYLYSPANWMEIEKQTTQTTGVMLTAIAAISLLVGGIGVMNIMLASVTERKREIGIRKAVGARRTAILLQFLVEAAVLCVFGGLVGIALGVGTMEYLGTEFGWIIVVTREAIVLAAGCAVGVGVASGLYPAIRAAWRDPIEALRHE